MRSPEEVKQILVSQWLSKAHNIGVLLDLASSADPELAARLAGASTLTPFGVELRYPGDAPEPDVGETRGAVGLAEQVRDEVLVRLG